jgi:hypothetical protein
MKQILTNNAGDSLQPGSKPAQDQADSRQYDSLKNPQGRADGQFGYGGSASTDGAPDQSRPRDDVRYPSGQQDRQGRRDTDDAAIDNGRSVGGKEALTSWHLQGVPGFGKPTAEPERTGQDSGVASLTWDHFKRAAGTQSSDRLEKGKSGIEGNGDYGSTEYDQKGDKSGKRQGYENRGY